MSFDNPQSLYAHGLSLFRTIFSLVFTLFNALTSYYLAHPELDSVRVIGLALECLTALISLEYTLHSAPERITPRQLLRLAKASRALTRLTGQTFDFTPWTSLSASELSDLDRLYPPPTNPYAEYRPRPYELRLPSFGGSSATSLLLYPGATLANIIKKLARILPPDFTGSADVPSAHASADPSASASPEAPAPALSPSPSHAQSALETASPSPSPSHAHAQSTPAIPSTPSIASHASHSSHPSSPSHPSHSPSAVLLADPYLSPSLKNQISTRQSSPCPPVAQSPSLRVPLSSSSPRPPG